jgi:hypothetical protein
MQRRSGGMATIDDGSPAFIPRPEKSQSAVNVNGAKK